MHIFLIGAEMLLCMPMEIIIESPNLNKVRTFYYYFHRHTSHYARQYMSNGMIHAQRSFREFARGVNMSQVRTLYLFLSYRRRQ